MFYGLVAIPARHLFGVTTTLITFLAAGMAAQCVVFLQQAGFVTALSGTLWDTSAILPDDSIPGRVAHVLFGYVDQPSGAQALVYSSRLWPFSSPPGWRRRAQALGRLRFQAKAGFDTGHGAGGAVFLCWGCWRKSGSRPAGRTGARAPSPLQPSSAACRACAATENRE